VLNASVAQGMFSSATIFIMHHNPVTNLLQRRCGGNTTTALRPVTES
jgi:hypothetical protein